MSTLSSNEGPIREPTSSEGILKVSATSAPQAVAASIAKSIFDDHHYPTLRAIGHGAIGQAAKAIAISRGITAVRGIDLSTIVGFETVINSEGHELSAIVFHTYPR